MFYRASWLEVYLLKAKGIDLAIDGGYLIKEFLVEEQQIMKQFDFFYKEFQLSLPKK